MPTPLGIASKLGWIEQEFAPDGIQVKTLQDQVDPKLRESHFDHNLSNSFRQGGNIPAIWARSIGRETRLLGLTWTDEAQVILTLPSSGIRTVDDLAGKKLGVAVSPAASIDFWRATTLRAYVAALKLVGKSERHVELVEIERAAQPAGQSGWNTDSKQHPSEVKALLEGKVDAIFHKGSRGLEIADAIGAHVIFDLGKHPDPKVRINNGSPRTLTVDAGLLESNPDLAVRLVRRVLQAGRWAQENPRQAVSYVAQETRSSEAAVERAYGSNVGEHLATDLEESSIAALSDFKDFLFNWRFLPNDFDVRSWIDPKPLALARKLLDSKHKKEDVARAAPAL